MPYRGLPKIRLVLGTGRCGTWAWYRIMEAQSGLVQSSHEGFRFEWEVDRGFFFYRMMQAMVDWVGTPIWCNSSFAWIRYVGLLMQNLNDPKCLCLKRDRDSLIDSFMRHWPSENYWTDPGSDHWDGQWPMVTVTNPDPDALSRMWPKYDLPKEDAIGAYWDEYYAIAEFWQQRLPANFKIIDFKEALNSYEGQDGCLEFMDIPKEKRRHYVGARLNSSESFRGMLYKEVDGVHGPVRVHEDPTLIRQEIIGGLRSRSGEIRGEVDEGLGGEDPAVHSGNAIPIFPISGSERHTVPSEVGHGADVDQRAPDDGDLLHGEDPGEIESQAQG